MEARGTNPTDIMHHGVCTRRNASIQPTISSNLETQEDDKKGKKNKQLEEPPPTQKDGSSTRSRMTENHYSNYEATVIDSWGAKFFYFGRCSPTLSDSSSRSLARLCPRPVNFFSQWKIQRKRTFTEFIYARLCPCSSQSMRVYAYIIIHTCLISIQSIDTHSLHWLID